MAWLSDEEGAFRRRLRAGLASWRPADECLACGGGGALWCPASPAGVFCGVAWIRESAPREGQEGRVDVGLASIDDPVYVEMKDI